MGQTVVSQEKPNLFASTILAMIDSRTLRVPAVATRTVTTQINYADEEDSGSNAQPVDGLTSFEPISIAASSTADVLIGAATEFMAVVGFYSFLYSGNFGMGQMNIFHNGVTGGGGRLSENGDADSNLSFDPILAGGNFLVRVTNGNAAQLEFGLTAIQHKMLS